VGVSNALILDGWKELGEQLRALPPALVDDARAIVRDAATAAGHEIETAYPLGRTGALKRDVEVVALNDSEQGAAYKIRSRAPHAWIVDHGTRARETKGTGRRHKYRAGINRGIHPKPAREIFIPTAIRHRNVMKTRLVALVRAAGFTVTGTP
jgi:hypothetical protein